MEKEKLQASMDQIEKALKESNVTRFFGYVESGDMQFLYEMGKFTTFERCGISDYLKKASEKTMKGV
jgi:radical SAM superfamily enzyme YgiQ (UPF0313 family)